MYWTRRINFSTGFRAVSSKADKMDLRESRGWLNHDHESTAIGGASGGGITA